MENWHFKKDVSLSTVFTAVTLMAAVILAYADTRAANAVQDVQILTTDKNVLMLREDLVKRLDRIQDEITEIRKHQERNR